MGALRRAHSARCCDLPSRAVGLSEGHPGGGGGARAAVSGIGLQARTLFRLLVLQAWGGSPAPTDYGRSTRAWGPILPTVRVPLRVLRSLGSGMVPLGGHPPKGVGFAWHLLPSLSSPRCAHFPCLRQLVAFVSWHLFLCRGFCRRRASLLCLMATRWCAVAPPVRSLSEHQSASSLLWCLLLPVGRIRGFTGWLRGARGGWPRTGLMVPAARPRSSGALGLLCVVPVRGPVVWWAQAGPSGIRLWLCALRWFGVSQPGQSRIRFPVPSALQQGCRPVHRGCFVWTTAPPLSDRRTPRPSAVPMCVCLLFLAGSGGLASRVRLAEPRLSLGRSSCWRWWRAVLLSWRRR